MTPAIHPFVAVVAPDQTDHTPEFAVAAALDLLTDPALRASAWTGFRVAAEGGA